MHKETRFNQSKETHTYPDAGSVTRGRLEFHSIFKMHSGMNIGTVYLRVSDLDAALLFYVNELGLKVIRRDGGLVELASTDRATEALIALRESSEAKVPPNDAAGLYHFAIILPDRKSLAAAYLKLGNAGVVFDGYADHLVSEALYLRDPEGNGIEIYADRPHNEWPLDEEGNLLMATNPLDVDSLVSEVTDAPVENLVPMPEGTRIGHIHLKVTGIKRSTQFYQTVLGLDLMSYWGSAAFLAAGAYHHHIGLNTWESLMGQPCRDSYTGLDHFKITVPDPKFAANLMARLHDSSAVEDVAAGELVFSDPDGIRFQVQTAR